LIEFPSNDSFDQNQDKEIKFDGSVVAEVNFSKVGSLLNLLYKMTAELTFVEFHQLKVVVQQLVQHIEHLLAIASTRQVPFM